MKKPTHVAIDGDILAFKAASAIEDRYILVTHIPSGRVKRFENRTEFYGHHSKKAGGWLAELNKEREEQGLTPFLLDEFEIVDDRDVEDVTHAYQICKQMIQGIVKACKAKSYVVVVEGEGNFRNDVATILEYKGNRRDQIKPLYIDEVKSYLINQQPSIVAEKIETDDILAIVSAKGEAIQVTNDKDSRMVVGWSYDIDKSERPFEIKDGVGRIWTDNNGKIRAMGFKSLCIQLLCGDDIDNLKPRALAKKRFGEKKAVPLLDPLTTKKDCLEAVLGCYKSWYPSPVTYKHWKTGEEMTKNYFQIASEIFTLLYMLRDYDDDTTLASLCDELGVDYDL